MFVLIWQVNKGFKSQLMFIGAYETIEIHNSFFY